jgi:group I intron endonuclease
MRKGIYIIKNKINNKVYVGQSKMLGKRYYGHLYRIKRSEHHNEILQRAFEKYGFDNFIYEVIEEVLDDKILNKREKYWIDFYGGINSDNVYNLKDPLLNEYSDYVKNKLSKNNSGVNNPNYGNKWTKEMKDKASNNKKGKTWEEMYGEIKSIKMKEKASKSQSGRKHSEKTKEKIRQQNIGEKNPAYGNGHRQCGEKNPMYGKLSVQRRPVLQFDKKGNFIKEYNFLSEVKKDGFHIGNVASAAIGRLKTTGGFIWKYK